MGSRGHKPAGEGKLSRSRFIWLLHVTGLFQLDYSACEQPSKLLLMIQMLAQRSESYRPAEVRRFEPKLCSEVVSCLHAAFLGFIGSIDDTTK
jgi:hypothetical protein